MAQRPLRALALPTITRQQRKQQIRMCLVSIEHTACHPFSALSNADRRFYDWNISDWCLWIIQQYNSIAADPHTVGQENAVILLY